jgi:glycosyltransferase involved in cell wall biosynthesis
MRYTGLSQPLHIDVVTETFPPEVNGVAMTLGRLTGGLQSLGHAVRVFRPRQFRRETAQHNGSFNEQLLPGVRLPMYRDLQLGLPATARLAESWRRQRPAVVYVATEGPLGWSAVRCAARLEIPVVSGFHTNFHTYSRHYRLGWLEPVVRRYLRSLHRHTACTLAPTETLAEQLRGAHFGRVEVLQRGVDTGLFNPRRRSATLRKQWGVGDDELVCLYVGRIAPEKNIEEAAASVSTLRRHFPAVRFVLVGDGPLRHKLARSHPEFLFCSTRVGEDLARHYASADLFLFPSRSETFGNVVTEAMASGLAVVAYDRAAAGEHIRHNENGALVRTGAAPNFADTVLELYRQPQRVRELGSQAARYARRLDWDSVVERFVALLRETAEGIPYAPAVRT